MLKHIPNFITLLNLFCGLLAIITAFTADLWVASLFVLAASILDFLDGFTARLLNAYSELGKQLDSLSDLISFGLAPAIVLYALINNILETADLSLLPVNVEKGLSYLSFLVVLGAALRLARFNIDSNQQFSFVGLPTPASAIFVVSLPLINKYHFEFWELVFDNQYVLPIVALLLSYLMLSNIHMFSLKFKHFTWRENEIRYIFLGICVILLITLHFVSIPLIIVLYVLLSLIENIVRSKK